MKRTFSRILQFSVTVAVLGWIFHDPALRAGVSSAVKTGDPRWLAIGFLVAGLGEAANILRWGLFLRVQKISISWARITALFLIGVFFGLFLFGTTGGDIVKAIYLARDHGARKAALFLTIVADRLIGLFVLLPFTLVLVVNRHRWLSQTPIAHTLLWVLVGFIAASLIFIVGSFVLTCARVVHKLPAGFPARAKLVEAAAAYALFGKAWKASFYAFLLSFPVLFTYFGVFYCAARAFRSGVSLGDIFSVMPIITFVTSLPVSISGLGVREEMFKTLLHDLDGVPPEVGVLISLGGFLIYVLWSLPGACAHLWMRPKPVVADRVSRESS